MVYVVIWKLEQFPLEQVVFILEGLPIIDFTIVPVCAETHIFDGAGLLAKPVRIILL